MPYWVWVRLPRRKMLRLRGPYESSGKADRRKDDLESDGYECGVEYTMSWRKDEAIPEIKEKISDKKGIEVGSSNMKYVGAD